MARATTTRADILDSAVRLFAAHGFRGTSLQDIATDAGCSKASLLYHFTNKDAILTELLAPVGPEFAELEARLAGLRGEEAARAAVTGLVDLSLRFRLQVKILLQDVDALINRPELPDADHIVERLTEALSGRSDAPEVRVWAWMAMLGIILTSASECVIPEETLRAELTRGALRTLGLPTG
ncbi:TetR/AcrR family transcriptional regulator [Microbispora triticiradicis]|uniref:TetR/AcrR family transcriptional regulator n=1 Tax=Microbispora triticiradicis TaxID=2200763 RepID=UPI001AD6E0BA|nr:TetR family transcriptional regulator [Microbispora triticiradicis]MBO4271562.1 TetR family transcriptional regulator [Microbispora triticiradicis]